MANILTMLEKEVSKENTFLDKKGNFISIEKIEDMARKSYVADLKAGSISFDVTYYEYLNNIMEDFVPVASITNFIKGSLKNYEVDSGVGMSDPITPAEYIENVAN